MSSKENQSKQRVSTLRAHPWHGVAPFKGGTKLGLGSKAEGFSNSVNCYIEITPADGIKYEVDKESGILMVDRPQAFSSLVPTLYGFIPSTYCGDGVAKLAVAAGCSDVKVGDGDPIDICVLAERQFSHGDILLSARPVGGIRMIDDGEVDDKIIAVLEGDIVYGSYTSVSEIPTAAIHRLVHYFLTYKLHPESQNNQVRVGEIYDAETAYHVINQSIVDYSDNFTSSY
jgi:inorganic pyrophosphatase